MPGLPSQQALRASNVQRVMRIRHRHHVGPDKRLLALVQGIGYDRFELGLRPSAGGSDRLGQAQCGPVFLAVDEIADFVLQRVIAQRLRLANQHFGGIGQLAAAIDRAHEGIDHIVAMEHRLPDQGRGRIEVALQVALVNAHDLVGQGGHHHALVVDACQPQNGIRHGAALAADDFLGL